MVVLEDLEAEVQRLKGQLEYAIRLNRELDTEKDMMSAELEKIANRGDGEE